MKIIVLLLVFTILFIGCAENKGMQKAIELAEGNEVIKLYVLEKGYERSVEELTAQEVIDLKKENQELSSLPEKKLFLITYSKQGDEYKIIVDAEQEKVLEVYREMSLEGN